jgi:GMP synthase (glutamine-hydrolysing)
MLMSDRVNRSLMITLFQHGRDESAGTILEYLSEQRIPFETFRFYESDEFPGTIPEKLIVLGGQMSVNDERDYPHFVQEKKLIQEMIVANRPVLGICLGAQMIASAFGRDVKKGIREIGWNKITGCQQDWNEIFPDNFVIFHWHEESFDLPSGATLIAYGDAVKNQAFRIGSAVGVQFHPEVTIEIIAKWTKDLPDQKRESIIKESTQRLGENKVRCHALMKEFVKGWD